MQRADGAFQAGMGMALIGGGIAVGCLAKPAQHFLTKLEPGESGQGKDNLSLKCVKNCFASGATTSMVSTALYSGFIGTLLLTSRYNVTSVAQAAKLTSCLPLLITGVSTLNSTRLLLQRWAAAKDDGELIGLSLSAGLFGAVAAGCLRACYGLFPFKSRA